MGEALQPFNGSTVQPFNESKQRSRCIDHVLSINSKFFHHFCTGRA
jgi:hypothetical protein